ncbi:MAG: hypothetical protein V4689_11710 [Verrucomicrobiota bacterium]
MNQPDHHRPVEIEGLLSDTDLDDLDDMIVVDPYNRAPSSRKSDKSLDRLLRILDELETGKDDQ